MTHLEWRRSTGEDAFAGGGIIRLSAGNDTSQPFIAVGWETGADPNGRLDRGMIWRSANGDAWEAVTVEGNGAGSSINDVTVLGDQVIAVGGQLHTQSASGTSISMVNGTVWASSDKGATYQQVASGVGDGQFVKVLAGGPGLVASMRHVDTAIFTSSFTQWYSVDGHDWQQATVDKAIDNLNEPTSSARATDGTLLLVTNSAAAEGQNWGKPTFLVSADGKSWQVIQTDTTGNAGAVTWTGSQFVVTGTEPCTDATDKVCGAIWHSIDGHSWQKTGAAEQLFTRGDLFARSTLLAPVVVVAGTQAGQVGVAVWLFSGGPPVANADPDLAVDARAGSMVAANGIVVMSGYKRSPASPDSTDYVWTTAP